MSLVIDILGGYLAVGLLWAIVTTIRDMLLPEHRRMTPVELWIHCLGVLFLWLPVVYLLAKERGPKPPE